MGKINNFFNNIQTLGEYSGKIVSMLILKE